MRTTTTLASRLTLVAVLASTLALSACANMTRREQATATGAVVGGVAGTVICGGSVVCAGAGAAAGGIIGHSVATHSK
jgi:osmotically inducible lipoprotein OsmB